MPEDKRLYTFRIEPALLEGLEAIRERDGVPVGEQIRRAIKTWLEEKGEGGKGKSARKRAATRKRA